MINVTLKGAKKLARILNVESKRQEKALHTAIRVEAFRLRKELVGEIKKGAPGGKRFKSLTFLARGLGQRSGRRFRPDRPLSRLAAGIGYKVIEGRNYEVQVGFVGGRFSKMYRRYAKLLQEGFTRHIGPRLRRLIIAEGARRGKIEGGRTPFFLKKSTRRFKTPARPIMEPFWARHRREVLPNIRRNFKRKLAGKRI